MRSKIALNCLLFPFLALSFAGNLAAQTPAKKSLLPLPLTMSIPTPPTLFRGGALRFLCYEIDINNLSPDPWTVQRLVVQGDNGASLQTVEGVALEGVMYHPARPRDSKSSTPAAEIAPGESVIAYMWVALANDAAAPTRLGHTFSLKKAGSDTSHNLNAPSTTVSNVLPEISSPLRGKNWVATNGPSNTSGHRRALIILDGTAYIGQRYAIDWVQIGDNNLTYHGDAKDNHSYHCFGVEALAVADGTVVEVKDGLPENVPNEKPVVTIDLDTIAGNHVNLDLGGGVYAMYAHLQPGSLRVKLGDKVKRGQLIGLVGNTGNSSEPHLHFQLMNRNSPLASEGLPYALQEYKVTGRQKDAGDGKPTVNQVSPPEVYRSTMPLEDVVADFEP
jgi:hypothetical protein